MVETIESFVAKLRSEGVQAGQQEADKIIAEARQQAQLIVQEAKGQAEKLQAEAGRQAEDLHARTQTELKLGARDAVLKLRHTLEGILRELLSQGLAAKLDDADFLGKLLHELVLTYARADSEGKGVITIDLRPELREKLLKWALHEISEAARGTGGRVDIRGTLREAGFEYSVSDAKVEITLSSVLATLSEMVSPRLREILSQAAAEQPGASNPASA